MLIYVAMKAPACKINTFFKEMQVIFKFSFSHLFRKRSFSSSSSSSDDDLILRAKRREEEEKKAEMERQRLL